MNKEEYERLSKLYEFNEFNDKKFLDITQNMTFEDDKNPTEEMRDAKEYIYQRFIKPKYGSDCPMLEPDFNEGWK